MPRGARLCQADARFRKFGGAIHPRVFRPCVRVAANQVGRFVPAAHVATRQRLHAREATGYERRRISRPQHRRARRGIAPAGGNVVTKASTWRAFVIVIGAFIVGAPRGYLRHASHDRAGTMPRGARLCQADARFRKFGGAIHPRVFRPCVRVAANQLGRFVPAAHVATRQRLHAREATGYERRRISRPQHRRARRGIAPARRECRDEGIHLARTVPRR